MSPRTMSLVVTLALLVATKPASSQFVVGEPESEHEYAEVLGSLFAEVVPELNADFTMPSEVLLTSANCGQANAFYQPDSQRVIICAELVRDIHQRLENLGDDPALLGLALASQVVFVLVHEVGHALVHVLDLPIVGQEEDAVDQLATIFLADEPVLTMWAAEYWRGSSTGQAGRYVSAELFADEHDLNEQRFYNLACWNYGADPLVRSYVVQAAGLSVERAQRCASEYERMLSGWSRLLAPHLRNPDTFAELDPTRNASGHWRFMESMEDAAGASRCTAAGTLTLWEMAGDLRGQMSQEGGCVFSGAPVENNASAVIETGSVQDDSVTFTLASCTYEGRFSGSGRTQIEGTVVCSGGVTMEGTWRAVR